MNENFFLFQIANTLYAFDVSLIHEIIQLPELKSLADIPPAIAGFLNFHKEIIPVVDLDACLGGQERTYNPNDCVIILKNSDIMFGLIAQEMIGVRKIDADSLTNFSKIISRDPYQLSINHTATYKGDIVFIIDIPSMTNFLKQLPTETKASLKEFRIAPEDRSIFAERAQQLSKSLEKKTKQELAPLVVIQTDRDLFAIDPELIKEFNLLSHFTHNPLPPPHILGFMNLRGQIIPLIDIWKMIGIQPTEIKASSKVLIVKFEDFVSGIVVDHILDIVSFSREELKPNPLNTQEEPHQYVKNSIYYEGNVIGVLDIKKIMELIAFSATELQNK